MATWRDHIRPIIAKAIADAGTADPETLRAAIRAAYPYADRRYWPYKVWCSEVRNQLGITNQRKQEAAAKVDAANGQRSLFE